MPDEERATLVVRFIAARPQIEQRDRLLARFAERPSIVFGWRPDALFDLIEWDDEPLATEYRAFVEGACRTPVDFEISRLGDGDVFAAYFD